MEVEPHPNSADEGPPNTVVKIHPNIHFNIVGVEPHPNSIG